MMNYHMMNYQHTIGSVKMINAWFEMDDVL